MTVLFAPLSGETLRLMERIPALVEKTFPLPGRFRAGLPKDIAELSRLLTRGRGERELSYLSRPNLLSAYLRYFLPWNIFRLCRLLPGLDISLAPGDVVLDLGCGPLSFAAALWISRPDLRGLPLELRCVDRTGTVLEAGKKFFAALSGSGCPWNIKTIRGTIGLKGTIMYGEGKKSGVAGKGKFAAGREKPAALVCAVNVFNEVYGTSGNARNFEEAAVNAARLLDSCAAPSASVLIAEPGIPQSGEFIGRLRSALIEKSRFPRAPCPHRADCPVPGGGTGKSKKRWCHFAFDTEGAPAALHRLSAAAGIPKERAVLSFLFAGPRTERSFAVSRPAEHQPEYPFPAPPTEKNIPVRIISDAFPLPGGKGRDAKLGRYGCSARALVLLAGNRQCIEGCYSGALVNAVFAVPEQRDEKSGALLAAYEGQ